MASSPASDKMMSAPAVPRRKSPSDVALVRSAVRSIASTSLVPATMPSPKRMLTVLADGMSMEEPSGTVRGKTPFWRRTGTSFAVVGRRVDGRAIRHGKGEDPVLAPNRHVVRGEAALQIDHYAGGDSRILR